MGGNAPFSPEKLLTMVKDDVQTHYNVLSMEPTKIELEDKETTKTKTLKRISDYIVEAPESVEGFFCAQTDLRYTV